MARQTVSATYKGERVYLDTTVYPRQELLSLHVEPVAHDHDEAERIRQLATADESLSDLRVEDL